MNLGTAEMLEDTERKQDEVYTIKVNKTHKRT